MRQECRSILVALCLGAALNAGVVRAGQIVSVSETARVLSMPDSGNRAIVQLSLAQALELAHSLNPVSREANARVAAANARLRSARSLQNPVISLAQPFGRDTGGLDEDILITQTIEMVGKRGPKISQVRTERDAALSEKVGSAVNIVLSVKSAYYDALRADEDNKLAADALDITRRFADAAKTQYAAGDVARSNVLRSEVELVRAEQDLASAETEHDNRYAMLRSLIGLPDNSAIELTDKLKFSPVAYQLSDLLALALTNRPDLSAEKSLRDSLVAAVRVVRTQSRPDLFVEGRHSDLNPATGGSSIRLGIALPLLDLGRNRSDVAAAQAALAEQQAKLDEVMRAARLEVETAFNSLQQAQKLVESFENGRLDRAKELLDMAETGYTKGATSYLEVLDAQRVYRNEEADYARALASYNIAVAELEHAVGGKLS